MTWGRPKPPPSTVQFYVCEPSDISLDRNPWKPNDGRIKPCGNFPPSSPQSSQAACTRRERPAPPTPRGTYKAPLRRNPPLRVTPKRLAGPANRPCGTTSLRRWPGGLLRPHPRVLSRSTTTKGYLFCWYFLNNCLSTSCAQSRHAGKRCYDNRLAQFLEPTLKMST